MTNIDVDNLLSPSSGAPALKFPDIGTTWKGTVVDKAARQQTDFTTGDPKVWPNGDPMMEVIITLTLDDGDEGRLFVRGQMLAAVRQAVAAAGATTIDVGGRLAVKFEKEEPNKNPRFNAVKIYVAQYEPPTKSAVTADGLL